VTEPVPAAETAAVDVAGTALGLVSEVGSVGGGDRPDPRAEVTQAKQHRQRTRWGVHIVLVGEGGRRGRDVIYAETRAVIADVRGLQCGVMRVRGARVSDRASRSIGHKTRQCSQQTR